jgi:hypothetical protein
VQLKAEITDSLDNLEERYRGHYSILEQLQDFTIRIEYWDGERLTAEGLNYTDSLKDRFK